MLEAVVEVLDHEKDHEAQNHIVAVQIPFKCMVVAEAQNITVISIMVRVHVNP